LISPHYKSHVEEHQSRSLPVDINALCGSADHRDFYDRGIVSIFLRLPTRLTRKADRG
uniref:Uncharacterized protein n=1 Tax=Scleropages formosus TaxID=113540 RepID=A0A8C9S0F0_SCLFO